MGFFFSIYYYSLVTVQVGAVNYLHLYSADTCFESQLRHFVITFLVLYRFIQLPLTLFADSPDEISLHLSSTLYPHN
jgi:hypothetical protein